MRITIYIYHNQTPRRTWKYMHCLDCKRPMFKYSASELVISNSGIDLNNYEPGSSVIEFKCHNCIQLYNIWFQ